MNWRSLRNFRFPARSWPCLLLATGLLATLPVLSVQATLVVPLTVEQMAALSDDIVHVQVKATESDIYNGKIITRSDMRVVESLMGKRDAGDEIEMVTLGGEYGKLATITPGLPSFEEGDELILFLGPPATRNARRSSTRLNPDSPLNQSHQVIGGYQGRFTIVREKVITQVGDRRLAREEAKVVRSRDRSPVSTANAPTLEAFRAEVVDVVTRQSARRSMEKIPGVTGMFSVAAEEPGALAIRRFDPLPRVASEGLEETGAEEEAPANDPASDPDEQPSE